MSTGLIGAQDAEQQESGVKEPSAGSSKAPAAPQAGAEGARSPADRGGNRRETADAVASESLSGAALALDHIGRGMALIASSTAVELGRLEVFKMLLTSSSRWR